MRGPNLLPWLAVALVPAFSLTAIVTASHRAHYEQLAQTWESKGDLALRAHDPAGAVEAFRNALRFAREDRTLRLRLAESLAAAGRTSEARAYLLRLWDDQPGNGQVNLELARVAARTDTAADAVRYYHNAIEGAWPSDAETHRRQLRLELAGYLIERGDAHLAEAELIALAGDLPEDPAFRLRVAALLASADAHRRARAIYDELTGSSTVGATAIHGAAAAALALGDHAAVVRYLSQLPDRQLEPSTRDMLETSRLVLQLDPYRRGLTRRERVARARRIIEAVAARLNACTSAPPALQQMRDELRKVLRFGSARWARGPEGFDTAVRLAYRSAYAAREPCGALTPSDRALLILHAQMPEPAS
jgi:tetratricopeptide (TPR) repeat protein